MRLSSFSIHSVIVTISETTCTCLSQAHGVREEGNQVFVIINSLAPEELNTLNLGRYNLIHDTRIEVYQKIIPLTLPIPNSTIDPWSPTALSLLSRL